MFFQKIKLNNKGFTLVEILVALTLFSIITTGVYFAYANILDVTAANRLKQIAAAVVAEEVEILRNLPYEDVGIVGGAPAGKLRAEKTVAADDVVLTVETFVRNIDDPFDGTLGGNPNDTAPADYRLVTYRVTCPACRGFTVPKIEFAAIAAPRGLENSTNNGNLFVNVIDANGDPVGQADVLVENYALSPDVVISDETNNNGVLQLVDIPTSTVSYMISVSKGGYSSDKTYALGDFGSSTPVNLHSTVASQTITEVTFIIDKTSTLSVNTNNNFCAYHGAFDFDLAGLKLAAIAPDVKKFSTTTATNETGALTLSSLEWDNYTLAPTDPDYVWSGFSPAELSIQIDPNTSHLFTALVEPKNSSSVVVTAVDAAGAPIDEALVTMTGGSFSESKHTRRKTFSQTNWQGGQYADKSGNLEAENPGTTLQLVDLGGGNYATGTTEWLESQTFDLGTSNGTTLFELRFTPTSQPASTSLQLQIAASNDSNFTFVGPDGTPSSFYTATGTIAASLSGYRFFRYKVFMGTTVPTSTPTLNDLGVEFASSCIPSGQVFFTGLGVGNYDISISKSGFATATSSVSVSGIDWQHKKITLNP